MFFSKFILSVVKIVVTADTVLDIAQGSFQGTEGMVSEWLCTIIHANSCFAQYIPFLHINYFFY